MTAYETLKDKMKVSSYGLYLRELITKHDLAENVVFTGGCHGNLQGICSLVKGQKAVDVIAKVKGISCNGKPTSCPDQLACALTQAMQK